METEKRGQKGAAERERKAVERVQASQRFVMSQAVTAREHSKQTDSGRKAVAPSLRASIPQILGTPLRSPRKRNGLNAQHSPIVQTPNPSQKELGLQPRPFPSKMRESKEKDTSTVSTPLTGVQIPKLDFGKLNQTQSSPESSSKHYRQLISMEMAENHSVIDSEARFNYSPRPIPVKPLVHLQPRKSLLNNSTVLHSTSGTARTGRLPRRGMDYDSPILFREVVTDRGPRSPRQLKQLPVVNTLEDQTEPKEASDLDDLLRDIPADVAPHHLPLDLFELEDEDARPISPMRFVKPAVSKYLHADGSFEWRPCNVLGYDEDRQRYKVTWCHTDGDDIKYVGRLNLRMLEEEEEQFNQRLLIAKTLRDETEKLVRLVYYWDAQPDDAGLKMPPALLQRILNRARGSNRSPLPLMFGGDADGAMVEGVETHFMRVQKLIMLAEKARKEGNRGVLQRLVDADLLPSGPPVIPGQPRREDIDIVPQEHSTAFHDALSTMSSKLLQNNDTVFQFLNAAHMIATERYDLCLFKSIPDDKPIELTRWVGEVELRLVSSGRDIRVTWPTELIDCMREILQKQSRSSMYGANYGGDDEFTFILPSAGAAYHTLSHHREPDPDARWNIPISIAHRILQYVSVQQEYTLGVIVKKAMHDINHMLARFIDASSVSFNTEGTRKRVGNKWPTVVIPEETENQLPSNDIEPIFIVQVILLNDSNDDNVPYAELCFEPPLEHFHEQLVQAFDDAVAMCNGVCRIDGIILCNPMLEQRELVCPVSDEIVAERREKLNSNVIRAFAGPQLFQQRLLDTYGSLIDQHESRIKYVGDFVSNDPTLGDYRREIDMHQTRAYRIQENLPSCVNMGPFAVDLRPVRNTLATMSKQLADELLNKLHDTAIEERQNIEKTYIDIMETLRNTPQSPEEWTEISKYVSRIDEIATDLRSKIDGMMAKYDLLSDFLYDINSKESEEKYNTLSWPPSILAKSKKTEALLEQAQADFEAILVRQNVDLRKTLVKAIAETEKFDGFSDMSHADEYLAATTAVKTELEESQKLAAKCNSREEIFGIEVTEFGELDDVVARLEPHARLWRIATDWAAWYNEWYFGTFSVLHAASMSESVDSCITELIALKESLKKMPGPAKAAAKVLLEIQEFKNCMPLVHALRNAGMRLRHWKRVGELTGMQIDDVDIEFTVTLSALVETHHMMDYLNDIDQISALASEELVIELQLDKMQSEWHTQLLTTELYLETKAYILQRPDASMRLIEDQLVAIQALMQSKHVAPHLDRISLWERKLARTQDVFDEWLRCQRGWMHFQPIFSVNDLINVRPNEARRFAGVDRKWREIMLVAVRTPKALVATSTPKLLETLRDCNRIIDEVRDGLASWLDQKRITMPRLFFLSNDELYSILFLSTADHVGITSFLQKLFPGVTSLALDDEKIARLNGKHGDSLSLTKPVGLGRSAEVWLKDLETSMRNSVSAAVQAAYTQWCEPGGGGSRDHSYGRAGAGGGEWKAMKKRLLLSWPSQISVLVHAIGLGGEVTEALTESDKDKRADKLNNIARRTTDLINKCAILLSVRRTAGTADDEDKKMEKRPSLGAPPKRTHHSSSSSGLQPPTRKGLTGARSVQDMRSVMANMRSSTWAKGLTAVNATDDEPQESVDDAAIPRIRKVFSLSNISDEEWDQVREPVNRKAIQSMIYWLISFRDVLISLGITEGTVSTEMSVSAVIAQQAEWIRYPRYVMEQVGPEKKVKVEQLGTKLDYGYEFLSAPVARLSTDAMFSAIDALGHGKGMLFTDSTSDKTLSAKSVADSLGRPCLVFNCGPNLAIKSLCRLIRGSVASGAFLLLEGLDLASVGTLSVIAGEIAKVQRALERRRVECNVGGVTVALDPGSAIIATMSRSSDTEIPTNLRLLFRPIGLANPMSITAIETELVIRGLLPLPTTAEMSSKISHTSSITKSSALLSQSTDETSVCCVGREAPLAQNIHWLMRNAEAAGHTLTMQQLHVALDYVEKHEIDASDSASVTVYVDPEKLLPDSLNIIWGGGNGYMKKCRKMLLRDASLFESSKKSVQFAEPARAMDREIELRETITTEYQTAMGDVDPSVLEPWVSSAIELHGIMEAGRSCIVVGSPSCGKSTTLRCLAAAITKLSSDTNKWRPVNMQVLYPDAAGYGLTFGAFSDDDCHDGLLVNAIQEHDHYSKESALWLVLDGSVDRDWMDGISGIVELGHVNTANGETISLPEHTQLIIETDTLTGLSPASLSQYTLLQLEPDDDPWNLLENDGDSWMGWKSLYRVMISEWLKNHQSIGQIDRMLDIFAMSLPQTLHALFRSDEMDIKRALVSPTAIIRTFLDLVAAVVEDADISESYETVFVFAWAWAIGGPLNGVYRAQIDAFLHTVAKKWELNLELPTNGTIFDYQFDHGHGLLRPWSDVVDNRKQEECYESDVFAAHCYIVKSLIQSNRSVLLTGPSNSGRSAFATHFGKRLGNPFTSVMISFTSHTSSASLRLFCERYVERRRKGVYAPPLGSKMLVVCDDVCRWPTKSSVVSRQGDPVSLLRQLNDQGGWYDSSMTFRGILDVGLLATTVDTAVISPRFARHFAHVALPLFDKWTLQKTLLHFAAPLELEVREKAELLVEATILLKQEIGNRFPEMRFNLHDIFSLTRGLMLGLSAPSLIDEGALGRLWLNEVLGSQKNSSEITEMCMDIATATLGLNEVKGELPIFAALPSTYEEFGGLEALNMKLDAKIHESRTGRVASVGTLPRMPHTARFIGRLSRAFNLEETTGIVVLGDEGDTRSDLVELTATLCNYGMIPRTQNTPQEYSWRSDLRRAMFSAGVEGKKVVLMLNDDDLESICSEEPMWRKVSVRYDPPSSIGPATACDGDQLSELINVVRTGDSATLWSADDHVSMHSALRPVLRSAGITDTPTNTAREFSARVLQNLVVVLSLVENQKLSRCLEVCPSLFDVFETVHNPSPSVEDLKMFAKKELSKTDLSSEANRELIADVCVQLHETAMEAAEYESQYAFRGVGSSLADITAPSVSESSYVELLLLFKSWLDKWRLDHGVKLGGIEEAADCADRLRELIDVAKVELRSVDPSLRAASDRVEEIVKTLAQQRFEEDALNSRVSLQEQALVQMQREAADTMELIQSTCGSAEVELSETATALRSVTRKEVDRERTTTKPNERQLYAMGCYFLIRGIAVRKDLWSESKNLMGVRDFTKAVLNVDVSTITPVVWGQLCELTTNFLASGRTSGGKHEKKERASAAITAYSMALVKHYQARQDCEPKYKDLGETQEQISIEQEALTVLQNQLKAVQEEIVLESVKHKEALDLRTELAQQTVNCEKQIERSNHLLRILKDDLAKWREKTEVRTTEFLELTGTALFSAACVSYLGPFSPNAQAMLVDSWYSILRQFEVSIPSLPPNQLLLPGNIELANCVARGLTPTDHARRMAACLKFGCRWPLILDSDGLGSKLLRYTIEHDSRTVVRLDPDDNSFLDKLKECVAEGSFVVISIDEGDVDALPRSLNLLIRCGLLIVRGDRYMIRLGDHNIEMNPSFRLCILSTSHGVTLPPSIYSSFNVINMAVSGSSTDLVSELVLEALAMKEKDGALYGVVTNATQMHASLELSIEEVEHAVVTTLNNGLGGDISALSKVMSDNAFVDKITDTKKKIGELRNSLRDVDLKGDAARESLQPLFDVSYRSSALYHALWDAPAIVAGARFSLHWFLSIVVQAVTTAMQAETTRKRAEMIWAEILKFVNQAAIRAIPEEQLTAFQMLMCARLLETTPNEQGGVSEEDLAFLLGRPPEPQLTESVEINPYPTWMTDDAWGRLVSLSWLTEFNGLLDAIAATTEKWQEVVQKAHRQGVPNDLLFPGGWSDGRLTAFQELLLWSCLAPSCVRANVLSMARDVIGQNIIKTGEMDPATQLYSSLRASAPLIPVLILCGPSADALGGIMNLAENQGQEHNVVHMSVGSGMGESVLTAIDDAIDRGRWVVVENPHLESGLIQRIRYVVAHIPPMRVNSDFRLWLSVPDHIGSSLPDSLVRKCITVSLALPASIRSELNHLLTIHRATIDSIAPDTPYRRLAFALLFVVATVCQRQQYGRVGYSSSLIPVPVIWDWDVKSLLNVLSGLVSAHGGTTERGAERQRSFERFPVNTLVAATNVILGCAMLSNSDRVVIRGLIDNIRWSSLVTIPQAKSGPSGSGGMGARRASMQRASRRRLSIVGGPASPTEPAETVNLLRLVEEGGGGPAKSPLPSIPAYLMGSVGPMAGKTPQQRPTAQGSALDYGIPEIVTVKSFQNYVRDQMTTKDNPTILGLPDAGFYMKQCRLGHDMVNSLNNVYSNGEAEELWVDDANQQLDAIESLIEKSKSCTVIWTEFSKRCSVETQSLGVGEGMCALSLLNALRDDLDAVLADGDPKHPDVVDAVHHDRVPLSWKKLGVRTGGGVWSLRQAISDVLNRCTIAIDLAKANTSKLPDAIDVTKMMAPRALVKALLRRAAVRRVVPSSQLRVCCTTESEGIPPPTDSILLTGLCIEGAVWESHGRLGNPKDSQLRSPISIRMIACGKDEQATPIIGQSHLFECPIYTSVDRADVENDDSHLGVVELSTIIPPDTWARRNVAIVSCDPIHLVGDVCV